MGALFRIALPILPMALPNLSITPHLWVRFGFYERPRLPQASRRGLWDDEKKMELEKAGKAAAPLDDGS